LGEESAWRFPRCSLVNLGSCCQIGHTCQKPPAKQLKATRSVRWATFRDELARLSEQDQASEDVQAMILERASWPRTDTLLTLGEARLSEHVEAATDLCTRLVDWIDNHSDSSCEPEETFRCFIQEDIHQILSETCNTHVDKLSAGKGSNGPKTSRVIGN